jgi:hypothetical protein
MLVLADRREIYAAAMPHKARVISRSSDFGRFMQILARQNIGADTETMVAKKSEESAEYGRDVQRRCRINEESPHGPVAVGDSCSKAESHRH